MRNTRGTDIIFQNLAVALKPPHMPFQTPLPVTLTLDFGSGRLPTTTYQIIGDNKVETTQYFQGGGAISLEGSGHLGKFLGSARLSGNIHYEREPQRLITEYNGPVQISVTEDGATLVADLFAVGHGPLKGKRLEAKLKGNANLTRTCGVTTLQFEANGLQLAVLV